MMSWPKRRVPSSNAVGSAGARKVSAIPPRKVAGPVWQISSVALPLSTDDPMNAALTASAISRASAVSSTACFSTGYDSPVSID